MVQCLISSNVDLLFLGFILLQLALHQIHILLDKGMCSCRNSIHTYTQRACTCHTLVNDILQTLNLYSGVSVHYQCLPYLLLSCTHNLLFICQQNYLAVLGLLFNLQIFLCHITIDRLRNTQIAFFVYIFSIGVDHKTLDLCIRLHIRAFMRILIYRLQVLYPKDYTDEQRLQKCVGLYSNTAVRTCSPSFAQAV